MDSNINNHNNEGTPAKSSAPAFTPLKTVLPPPSLLKTPPPNMGGKTPGGGALPMPPILSAPLTVPPPSLAKVPQTSQPAPQAKASPTSQPAPQTEVSPTSQPAPQTEASPTTPPALQKPAPAEKSTPAVPDNLPLKKNPRKQALPDTSKAPVKIKERDKKVDPTSLMQGNKLKKRGKQDAFEADLNAPVHVNISPGTVIIGGAVLGVILVAALIWGVFFNGGPSDNGSGELKLICGKNVKQNVAGAELATISVPSIIKSGSFVKTGSDRLAVLSFPDKSSLRLDSNTSIKISKLNKESTKCELTLFQGCIYIDEHLGTDILVSTRNCSITPVGTKYAVIEEELMDLTTKSTVVVCEGSVKAVHSGDQTKYVLVTADNQASFGSASVSRLQRREKDSWISWNNTWNDLANIPTKNRPKGERICKYSRQRLSTETYVAPDHDYSAPTTSSAPSANAAPAPDNPPHNPQPAAPARPRPQAAQPPQRPTAPARPAVPPPPPRFTPAPSLAPASMFGKEQNQGKSKGKGKSQAAKAGNNEQRVLPPAPPPVRGVRQIEEDRHVLPNSDNGGENERVAPPPMPAPNPHPNGGGQPQYGGNANDAPIQIDRGTGVPVAPIGDPSAIGL